MIDENALEKAARAAWHLCQGLLACRRRHSSAGIANAGIRLMQGKENPGQISFLQALIECDEFMQKIYALPDEKLRDLAGAFWSAVNPSVPTARNASDEQPANF